MIHQILLVTHIVAGFLSIVLFWLPAFSRKGGKLHVTSGKIYVYAMWVVVISAAILCTIRIAEGNHQGAVFLAFLALITSNPLWYGIAILKKPAKKYWVIKTVLDFVLVLGGAFLVGLGIYWWGQGPSILMLIFGSLGVTNVFDLRRSLQRQFKGNPIQNHINGMIISGIAAFSAFFVFGASSVLQTIFTGPMQIVPWVAPTVIGVIAMRVIGRKYKTN